MERGIPTSGDRRILKRAANLSADLSNARAHAGQEQTYKADHYMMNRNDVSIEHFAEDYILLFGKSCGDTRLNASEIPIG